jgi:hypothetical protein
MQTVTSYLEGTIKHSHCKPKCLKTKVATKIFQLQKGEVSQQVPVRRKEYHCHGRHVGVRWDQRRGRNGNGKAICKCLNGKTSNRRKHIIRRILNGHDEEKWIELAQERVRMRLWY